MARASTAASANVDDILGERIKASVARVLSMMPMAAKVAAASSTDVSSLFLNLARGIPAAQTDDPDLADSILNAAAFKRRMLDGAGGALNAEQVRGILGHKTIQAVYKAVKERRLLMVEDNGAKLFPACQFSDGAVLAAIPRILAAAPQTSGWGVLQYLVSGDEGLGEARPIDLIRGSDADIERVVTFARTLED